MNSKYFEEVDFASSKVIDKIYFLDTDLERTKNKYKYQLSTWTFHSLFSNFIHFLKSVFLPAGYPYSVPQEYLTFQIWNIIQDLCSYLRGIMSTRAVLEGLGVGRADISSVQATILWVIRDGASMVGGLLFTTFSSANFGQNVKAWRLFADYINNIGITLDLLAPLSQNLFLPLICMSSVFKALCGIAAGATGSVISEHWGSLNGNTAEVNSKNGAQHTAISLIGLLLSLPFTAIACRTPAIMWTVYTFLTVLHMVSNYIAMRTLRLRSINISRAKLLTQFFLEIMTPHLPADLKKQGIITENLYDVIKKHSKLFSTEYIASIEPILSLLILPMFKRINTKFKSKSGFQVAVMPDSLIHMWASPSEVFDHFRQLKIPSDDLQNMFSQMTNENKKGYALLYNSLSGSSNQEIFVCFSNKCTSQDQLLALLEANIILRFKTINLQDLNQLHRELSPLFLKCLEGWDFNRILLRTPNALAYST